jgi:hypothetical protein
MTDAVAIETPADPVPVPPVPELAAEVEAAPDAVSPEAAEPVAVAPAEKVAEAAPEGDAPVAAPEIVYSNGSASELVVDHFTDSEGDQSMNQIKAALPHIDPNTIESAVRRLWERGRLLKIRPGVYRLAPSETPPEHPKPVPPPQAATPDDVWLIALERFFEDPASWNVLELGPRPDEPDNKIPPDVRLRFADRIRKRRERERDREAAIARQVEADAALRNRLIAGCYGNVTLGATGLQDMAPVKAMLADGVPLEHILIGLKRTVDRRIEPRAAPISSWSDDRFLTNVARSALLGGLLPRMVSTWATAGMAPQKPVDRAQAQPAVSAPPDHENVPAASRRARAHDRGAR